MMQLIRVPRVMRLSKREEVLTAAYTEGGMTHVGLTDLLYLPNICRDDGDKTNKIYFTESMPIIPLSFYMFYAVVI